VGQPTGPASPEKGLITAMLTLVFLVVGAGVLYWIIRLAVYRAVRDALKATEDWRRTLD